MLTGKKILLGVTGGIAAYKCAHLVRLLKKQNAEVRVIITKSASDFVTAKTLSVLSGHEVISDFYSSINVWNNHVALAEWADLLLIAPLTANSLAKMANGQCDNVLLATYLSCRNKCMVAPAMDLEMYKHPTTIENLKKLSVYHVDIIPAESGALASGLSGEGRMAEPENIVNSIIYFFNKGLPLHKKNILINAGPTYEAIDPVRFIGNRSSGKMGIAIAEECAKLGAQVTLVIGPSPHRPVNSSIQVQEIENSEQMHLHCVKAFKNCDIAICTAAVSDYKPAKIENKKIKKSGKNIELKLNQTVDVIKALGDIKNKKQILVGFALETENLHVNAKKKLKEKNLDFIVANEAGGEGGFGSDLNQVSIIDKHNKITNFELKSKQQVASDILDYLIKNLI
ncbi:MAG: bifunctional phosphopantothenoylcysteine decarboxylase/phosphopantothenate--cysteine ligase CoaBC [Sphingobacteriaceae bacterium]|nr:bifunctional phosphopantothenoylcysteine decarboxylase/phosphopantothenate--cysteine ligase CoaBC [Sphingobacteriaceae bacterium]